jgi:hypothetical protein
LIIIKLDPYATSFGVVRVHVLIDKGKTLGRETIIEAMRAGRFFVGFDAFGDTSGFSFEAADLRDLLPQGTQIALHPIAGWSLSPLLRGSSPNQARFVLLRNGEKVFEKLGAWDFEFRANEAGAYRVEVYRDNLGPPFDEMPWILSNPIYVR